MNGAQQADERDRQIARLVKQIEALLPHPITHVQRLRFEEAVHMNLRRIGR